MSQDRNDYWWLFIKEAESLFNLASSTSDQTDDSYFYNQLRRLMDYVYGYDTDAYTNGVVFGHKVAPMSQSPYGQISWFPFVFSRTDEFLLITGFVNYNAVCINQEYKSLPNGPPIATDGSMFFGNKIYGTNFSGLSLNFWEIDNSESNLVHETVIQQRFIDILAIESIFAEERIFQQSVSTQILPPDNETDCVINSSLFFDIESKKFLHKILKGSTGEFIRQHQTKEMTTDNFDDKIYLRNALNSDFFPQPASSQIDVARIIWRIRQTTESNRLDHVYEYFIIDMREIYGYYGWKQLEVLSFIKTIFDGILFSKYNIELNMVELTKEIFSIIFNNMNWSPDFITYWENQGETISSTLQDLFDELAE